MRWRGVPRLRCRFGWVAFEGFWVSSLRLQVGNCWIPIWSRKEKRFAMFDSMKMEI